MNTKCYFCEKDLPGLSSSDGEPLICAECNNNPDRRSAAGRVWSARRELNDSIRDLLKCKHRGEPLRIANVFVFANGNVAVTDQFGEQMPELQGTWDEKGALILATAEAQEKKPIISDNLGIGARLSW